MWAKNRKDFVLIKNYLKQVTKTIMQLLDTSKLERVSFYYMEISNGNVVLHNGASVALYGPQSYCGRFLDLLVINRGIHEPSFSNCSAQ